MSIERNKAFIAAGLTAFTYGATYPVAKSIMPVPMKPYGLTLVRVMGATLLFWVAALWAPREKITPKGFLWLFATAVCGASLNMIFLFKGLSYTSPVNASIIVLMTPLFVYLNSYIFLRERIRPIRFMGVLMGLLGALLIILSNNSLGKYAGSIKGDLLVMGSPVVYSLYLIIMGKLTREYHIFTITKWSLFFGVLIVLPFGYTELTEVPWSHFSTAHFLALSFLVVGTSFLAVLFTLYALKYIKASTFSVFMYLQPIFTMLIIWSVLGQSVHPIQILAMLLVFGGCYLAANDIAIRKSKKDGTKE
ncbi:MAG: DMT family transporter [Flavobacteriaceae bacterium]